MGNMEESVYLCHQKQASCKDDLRRNRERPAGHKRLMVINTVVVFGREHPK